VVRDAIAAAGLGGAIDAGGGRRGHSGVSAGGGGAGEGRLRRGGLCAAETRGPGPAARSKDGARRRGGSPSG